MHSAQSVVSAVTSRCTDVRQTIDISTNPGATIIAITDIGERWIAKLFEPVRKAFFNGPQPPPMQFSMAEKVPDDAEVAVLAHLGGAAEKGKGFPQRSRSLVC